LKNDWYYYTNWLRDAVMGSITRFLIVEKETLLQSISM